MLCKWSCRLYSIAWSHFSFFFTRTLCSFSKVWKREKELLIIFFFVCIMPPPWSKRVQEVIALAPLFFSFADDNFNDDFQKLWMRAHTVGFNKSSNINHHIFTIYVCFRPLHIFTSSIGTTTTQPIQYSFINWISCVGKNESRKKK